VRHGLLHTHESGCGPNPPGHRGGRRNGLLRQYLPKGMDLSTVSAVEIRFIAPPSQVMEPPEFPGRFRCQKGCDDTVQIRRSLQLSKV
jgi:hypothetical protein